MKYPYIGKGDISAAIFLMYKDGCGLTMDRGGALYKGGVADLDEEMIHNITGPFLANTYGEVKSKEHAEFIVKLAKVNGFRLCNPEKTNKKWFCFDDNELYLFDDVEDASDLDEKLITIPLPPECEGVMEFKFDNLDEANKAVNLLEERFQSLSDLQTETADLIQNLTLEGVDVEAFNDILKDKERSGRFGAFIDWRDSVSGKMKEINVKQKSSINETEIEAMKMIERAKNDEWPKVGSKALLNNDNDYELAYGEELIGKEVEVINLFTDGYLEMAVVKHDVANYCFRIEMLSKPKTPEEKLHQDLEDSIYDNLNERGFVEAEISIDELSFEITSNLLSKYNITKKGEGNE